MDGKHQGEGGDGLFSTRQIIHGHEALPWCHAVVVDAAEVRLIRILCTENGLEHIQRTFAHMTKWKGRKTTQMHLIFVLEVLSHHLGAAVPAQSFIDLINYNGHMFEAAAKEVHALGFDLLELLAAFSGCSGADIEG